jgi:predicted 3-demethylubiquinone-9 3-methyltransferase (glyoxalase superfamily)
MFLQTIGTLSKPAGSRSRPSHEGRQVDTLWKRLSAGGKKIACGWLTDKFGVAWQICPTILLDYLNDKNPNKAKNVMQAMMKMQKIDINRIKKAYRKQ